MLVIESSISTHSQQASRQAVSSTSYIEVIFDHDILSRNAQMVQILLEIDAPHGLSLDADNTLDGRQAGRRAQLLPSHIATRKGQQWLESEFLDSSKMRNETWSFELLAPLMRKIVTLTTLTLERHPRSGTNTRQVSRERCWSKHADTSVHELERTTGSATSIAIATPTSRGGQQAANVHHGNEFEN